MCSSSSTVINIQDKQGREMVTTANIPNSQEVVIQTNNIGVIQRLPSRELLESKSKLFNILFNYRQLVA